jgi:catalase
VPPSRRAGITVRYRFVPSAGESYLDEDARKAKGPNYLSEEIPARLPGGPIGFDWLVQIAETGDKVDDPSVAWLETRQFVKLGTITIDRMISDPAADKSLAFMPGTLPEGIEAADPMLAIRNAAYPVSFGERQ